MKNCYQENITKEIIEELEGLRYVDKPNFKDKGYDYITVKDDGEYIELIVNEQWFRNEDGDYEKITDGYFDVYKKNNVSGVYLGVDFI